MNHRLVGCVEGRTSDGGDFIRFPGDVPHQTLVMSETAVLHMVTTMPHISQIEAAPVKSRERPA